MDASAEAEPDPEGALTMGKSTALVVPLVAGLMVLVLLGVYGDLNPPSTSVTRPRPAGGHFWRQPDRFGERSYLRHPRHRDPCQRARSMASAAASRSGLYGFLPRRGADGTVYGQVDTMPHNNQAPTSGWRPGSVISDTYTLTFKPGAPAGVRYRYVLGLYQYQTGQRLLNGASNQVELDVPK